MFGRFLHEAGIPMNERATNPRHSVVDDERQIGRSGGHLTA
jgi:hypothetical protein